MSIDLKATVENLIEIVENDALKAAAPLISKFLTAIEANPTKLGVAVAVADLQVSALATLPNLEQTFLQQLAALIQTQLQLAIAATTPATATA